jgi:hypothetical protein
MPALVVARLDRLILGIIYEIFLLFLWVSGWMECIWYTAPEQKLRVVDFYLEDLSPLIQVDHEGHPAEAQLYSRQIGRFS